MHEMSMNVTTRLSTEKFKVAWVQCGVSALGDHCFGKGRIPK